MHLSNALRILLGAASYASAVQFAPRQSADEPAAALGNTVPRRFIVELRSRGHAALAVDKIAGLAGLQVFKTFDSDIFPAVSVECDHDCNADSLRAALDGADGDAIVASVYQSTRMQLLTTVKGESFSDDAAASNYSVHGSTGVQALHDAGITGRGAIVAIVDSGVQYTHPALGGGIGPNYTVIGGYDLVGEDWPAVPAQPDSDPMDYFGHGTHVAGIIVGKSDQFVGVAPDAEMLSFKVFGKTGYSDEETVIEGFMMAFDSGADIITASLGQTSGFTSNAWAVVASRMVDQGVVITIAAGNDGSDGPFSMSNGASGQHVLTIASSDPGEFPAQGFTADFILDGVTNTTQLAYTSSGFFPSTILDWPVVPLTLDTSVANDACLPLPNNTANMTGTIVLVRYGGCTLYEKYDTLAKFNPQYILFYEDDGPYQAPITKTALTGVIEARAGEAIVNTILAGGNVTASFNVSTSNYVGLYNAVSGRPASYTTWGSTYDLALKPDIASPGTKILSTYPTNQYQVLSGTSMATPYIAGVAALWVGKFGGRAAHADDPEWAQRLHARIMSTARAVPWADWSTTATDYGFWAPTTQVGAGFVDALKVLDYTTQISFDGRKFEFNDTAHFSGTHSVDIANQGSESVTYKFSLQDAGGYDAWAALPANTTSYGLPYPKFYSDLVPTKMVPGVSMPGDLTIGPGETATAEFTFTVPPGLNTPNMPVYSGKVLISGSNGEELGIPYFGVASALRETVPNIWNYGALFPFLTSGLHDLRLDVKSNFTFNISYDSQDFPKLNSEFAWGSEELRWDIFDADYTEADWTYPPVIGEGGYVGSATSWNETLTRTRFDPAIDSTDSIFSFPLYDQPRGLWNRYYWLGRYANGSSVVPGAYVFRIAALLPFGDRNVASDWDIWATPNITFLP